MNRLVRMQQSASKMVNIKVLIEKSGMRDMEVLLVSRKYLNRPLTSFYMSSNIVLCQAGSLFSLAVFSSYFSLVILL